jgi:transmembrane sensor
MSGVSGDSEDIARAAADWFVRLQSDGATDRDWMSFETWLNADQAHEQAFAAVENLSVDLDLIHEKATSLRDTAKVVPFTRRKKTLSWGAWAAGGGIAAAMVIGVIGPRLVHPPASPSSQTIATAKGARKSVLLQDGTKVDLDSASVLVLSGENFRSIHLEKGQAAFAVRHNPKRPFTVYAGDRRIVDIGTVFDVARFGEKVEVTVERGEVAVEAVAASSPPATVLPAGRQFVHRDGDAGATVREIDPEAALAWRSGRLVYSDAPLQTVASDLNRYFATPIRVEGRRTAELRFSGVLILDSEDAVVGRLQAFLPVAVQRSSGAVSIRAR